MRNICSNILLFVTVLCLTTLFIATFIRRPRESYVNQLQVDDQVSPNNRYFLEYSESDFREFLLHLKNKNTLKDVSEFQFVKSYKATENEMQAIESSITGLITNEINQYFTLDIFPFTVESITIKEVYTHALSDISDQPKRLQVSSELIIHRWGKMYGIRISFKTMHDLEGREDIGILDAQLKELVPEDDIYIIGTQIKPDYKSEYNTSENIIKDVGYENAIICRYFASLKHERNIDYPSGWKTVCDTKSSSCSSPLSS